MEQLSNAERGRRVRAEDTREILPAGTLLPLGQECPDEGGELRDEGHYRREDGGDRSHCCEGYQEGEGKTIDGRQSNIQI